MRGDAPGGGGKPHRDRDPEAAAEAGAGSGRRPGRERLRTRIARRVRADERLVLAVALVAVTVMTTAYFQLPLDHLGPRHPLLSWTVLTGALACVALLLLRQTYDVLTGRPGTRPGLAIPLLMCLAVLVFAGCYYVLAAQPGQFRGLATRVDALYFTLVTLATIGYGDITARGQTARVVTILQILYTFVFLTAAATALGRRVRGMVVRRHPRPGAGGATAAAATGQEDEEQ